MLPRESEIYQASKIVQISERNQNRLTKLTIVIVFSQGTKYVMRLGSGEMKNNMGGGSRGLGGYSPNVFK